MKPKPVLIRYLAANNKPAASKLYNLRFDGKAIRAQEKIRGRLVNRSFLPSELVLDGLEKSIGWSYPTSTNADNLGFKTGCFSVSIGKPHNISGADAIAGFATAAEAKRFADLLPIPFSQFTMGLEGFA